MKEENLNQKDFAEWDKNRNLYRVLKPLIGQLSGARIGSKFYSDQLYERGYNIIGLVEDGFLELAPDVFPFEKKIIGTNVHSVYVICTNCGSQAINAPLNKVCGNCNYTRVHTYYDAETIDNYLRTLSK